MIPTFEETLKYEMSMIFPSDMSEKTLLRRAHHRNVLMALKYQIPTNKPRPEFVTSNGKTCIFSCNQCGKYIEMPIPMKQCDYKYCPYCGQRWSE